MTAVTAKAQLSQKNIYGADGTSELTFAADYADGRNKEWSASTPSLTFKMTVKGAVADLFVVGSKYTVTFEPTVETPAEPEPLGEAAEPEPAA